MNVSLLVKDTLWNLMLAIIPVFFAYGFVNICKMKNMLNIHRIPLMIVLFALWLVFLPNTCYLITEWRHFFTFMDSSDLYSHASADKLVMMRLSAFWLFYFLYSSFGMLCFTLAIRPIEQYSIREGIKFWILPLNMLLALGVYLGLVLRFNSWDLATRPRAIFHAIHELMQHPKLTLFIVAFGVFLWIAYRAVDVWVDGLMLKKGKLMAICFKED